MKNDDILKIPTIQNWINQFDDIDRYTAEYFLQSLRYISFEEFEETLQNTISELIETIRRNRRNKIAIFTVTKNLQNEYNIDKEYKKAKDSSGRIGHLLTNLERKFGSKIEVFPRKKSMKDSNVRDIIIVDDFIGSGKRFIKFWRNDLDKTIKSWVSGKYCNIWLVSHSLHKLGKNKILTNIKSIKKDNIITVNFINESILLDNSRFKDLFNKYGKRTKKNKASLGFGNICTNIVFQHGCPNNAPSILWSSGTRNKNDIDSSKWIPLFFERSIDTSLYPLFSCDFSKDIFSELLWSSGQYKTALRFLEKLDDRKFKKEMKLIVVILGLSSRNMQIDNIKKNLVIEEIEVEKTISKMKESFLLNTDGEITRFGRDSLAKFKKKSAKIKFDNEYINYYPYSFMGLYREN